ncbi:MAG: lipopolysaccharide assembly protein LapA domain-containing protein [Gordonia sp. (in: high G+C Gram-positive bacteria)]
MTTQDPSNGQHPVGPDDNADSANYPPAAAQPDAASFDDAITHAVAGERDRIKQVTKQSSHTRAGFMYVGWIVGVVALILLLVFIVANQDSVAVNFLFGTVELPVGVTVLVAAIIGALITGALGAARIIQLNRALKKASSHTD